MRPVTAARLAATFLLAAAAASAQRAPRDTTSPQATNPPPLSGPCAASIKAIKPGSTDPDAFLAAAACLRKSEPARAADSAAPAQQAGDSAAIHVHLKRLLPPAETWYTAHLERLRARRDLSRLEDMAWLAALRDPSGAEAWREIAESQTLAGRPLRAAMAQLKQAEKDSAQAGFIQYQLDALVRSLHETPAPAFLDSLLLAYRHVHPVTAELMETLCWNHRHPAGAYASTAIWMALRNPGPGPVLERAGRYHAGGWFDYADRILERAAWRRWPGPWKGMARALFLRVRYQLEDWPAIAAEIASAAAATLTEEEDYIGAAAALSLGRPAEALSRLARFDAPGESQWGYRARLLKSRALLAQGKLPEAARLLDALKRSPHRREGTGPILFWQGWLALQQGQAAAAESLLVLASAYTGDEESQRALEFRQWMLLDSGLARAEFFRGVAESHLGEKERIRALDKVPEASPLWPHAQLEKAQILAEQGLADSARTVLDHAAKGSQDRLLGLKAEALAAWLQEKSPGGRAAALARYENLLIQYQQGVIPEFSRSRIRALK